MRATSASQIVKKLDHQNVSLQRGEGYWYFIYDAPDLNVFETKSVMVMYLNSLSVESWLAEGRAFITEIEARIAEANEIAAEQFKRGNKGAEKTEAQAKKDFLSDMDYVHKSLREWAEGQLDAGASVEELKERLQEAVKVAGRE